MPTSIDVPMSQQKPENELSVSCVQMPCVWTLALRLLELLKLLNQLIALHLISFSLPVFEIFAVEDSPDREKTRCRHIPPPPHVAPAGAVSLDGRR